MTNAEQNDTQKIVWLASYPKSGNTWFRAFLTALLNEGELDINEMKTDGIFSSRQILEAFTDLDSTYLYADEVKTLIPEVFVDLESFYQKENLFIKIHDAYTCNQHSEPIVPTKGTRCGIYLIRNPLDVVGSFANHNNKSIDETIALMNKSNGTLAKQNNNLNLNNQFEQLMFSWSRHVESWTAELPFPVLVVRYEDMLNNTLATFSKAVEFMGINVTIDQIETAIEVCKFEKLQQKEKEKGFTEKNARSPSFFRKGQINNWTSELTEEQAQEIIDHHKKIMELYSYL